MTEKSWPWSTVAGLGDGAAELGEANSREFLALYFLVQVPETEGVCKGLSIGELEVTGIATPLSVDPGAAVCYGLYINDAIKTLAVSTPGIGTTGGRVVLQTNWAGTGGAGLEARTRLAVKMSADGNPAIPALTQNFGTTWEISLATFTVTVGGVITVTDDRTFRKSTAMVDTDEIYGLAVTTAKIDNLAVTLAKMAADSVDDTKVGNRVPQFYRRQGNSATDWSSAGTTNYTPTMVRMQGGTGLDAAGDGEVITFPVPFSNVPIVLVTSYTPFGYAYITAVSATQFTVIIRSDAGVTLSGPFFWLAIGLE